jgi:hypothetical protein
MERMPPTTEPLSGNFLDETFVWILTALSAPDGGK